MSDATTNPVSETGDETKRFERRILERRERELSAPEPEAVARRSAGKKTRKKTRKRKQPPQPTEPNPATARQSAAGKTKLTEPPPLSEKERVNKRKVRFQPDSASARQGAAGEQPEPGAQTNQGVTAKPTNNKNGKIENSGTFKTPEPVTKRPRRTVVPTLISPNSTITPEPRATPLRQWMSRHGISQRFAEPLEKHGIGNSNDIAKLNETDTDRILTAAGIKGKHLDSFKAAKASTEHYKYPNRPKAADYFGGGVFGLRQQMIELSQTAIKVLETPELGSGAKGVFTTGLPADTFITWYEGDELNETELDRVNSTRTTPSGYIMQLNTGPSDEPAFIDATDDETGSNFARRVNNCGEGQTPNCTFFQDDGMVYLITLRRIDRFEQLTVDYDGGPDVSFIWPAGTKRLNPRPFCTQDEWNQGTTPPKPYSYTRARIGTTGTTTPAKKLNNEAEPSTPNTTLHVTVQREEVESPPELSATPNTSESAQKPAAKRAEPEAWGRVLKLMSANLNSFRRAYERGLIDKIIDLEPDIAVFQEHMLFNYKELLEKSPKHRGSLARIADAGYHISVNECRVPRLKGHHGTMVISKIPPKESRFSANNPETDDEGRVQIEIYDPFIIINVYAPQPGLQSEHTGKRARFLDGLTVTITELREEFPDTPIIMCGDMNVAPQLTDCYDTRSDCNVPGHKPQEREAWSNFRNHCMFEDVFETLHPEGGGSSTWWPTKPFNARRRDRGLRLDHFVHDTKGRGLTNIQLSDYARLDNTRGSDHCPIQCNVTVAAKRSEQRAEVEKERPQANTSPRKTIKEMTATAADALEVDRMTAALMLATTKRGKQFKVQFAEANTTKNAKPPWILIRTTRKPHSRTKGKDTLQIDSINSAFTLQDNGNPYSKPDVSFTVKDENGSIRGRCSARVKDLMQLSTNNRLILDVHDTNESGQAQFTRTRCNTKTSSSTLAGAGGADGDVNSSELERRGQIVISSIQDETPTLARELATLVVQHNRRSSVITAGGEACPVNHENTVEPPECQDGTCSDSTPKQTHLCTPIASGPTSIQESDTMVFFHRGWPSQFTTAPFAIGGVKYFCCEQFMMAEKARTFRDREAETKIMSSDNPREIRNIGRTVKNFNETEWNRVCRDIVLEGNFAKYTQNPEFKKLLLATGDKCMVEAAKSDERWGVGLHVNDPRIHNPKLWQGTNWLGHAINAVRQLIRDGVEELNPDTIKHINEQQIVNPESPNAEPTEEKTPESEDNCNSRNVHSRKRKFGGYDEETSAIELECAKAASELTDQEQMKPCPHLTVRVNERASCQALADSGATTCIGKLDFVCEALNMTSSEISTKFGTRYGPSMRIADGSRIKATARVPLEIEFTDTVGNKHRVKQSFWVMESLSTDLILGIELWRKQGLQFDFDNDTLVMDKALP